MSTDTDSNPDTHLTSPGADAGSMAFWGQADTPGPPAPRRGGGGGVPAWLAWTVAVAATGAALAVLALDSQARWPMRAVRALVCLVGGWALAATLWVLAAMSRQQQKLLRRQQRILDLLGAGMFPTIMEVGQEGDVAEAAAQPVPTVPVASADDDQTAAMLERMVRELAEIRADMLLTPEQLERKRADVRRREQEETYRRFQEFLSSGNLPQAQSLFRTYVVAFGEDETATRLRQALSEAIAARIEPALDAGELSVAQRWIARLVEIGADDDRLAAYEQRLAQWLVDDVDRLLNKQDLAAAESMLDHLEESFPDDPRCVQLRKRLSAVRNSLAEGEITAQRQRIEEWMALARYDQAREEAQELALRYPDNREAADMLAAVLRESSAWRDERRQSLYRQVLRCAESKQWTASLEAANQLVQEFPDCDEARDTRAMLELLSSNARIEQVRALRDDLTDMIHRRRYAEAVQIARDLIDRFPDTQAAIELRTQLPGLMARAASGEGHPL